MDMKPKNVLLTPDYSIAKIADVGLAHIMGNTAQGSQAMGTFAYAAPEQLLNKPCDEKVLPICFLSAPCACTGTVGVVLAKDNKSPYLSSVGDTHCVCSLPLISCKYCVTCACTSPVSCRVV